MTPTTTPTASTRTFAHLELLSAHRIQLQFRANSRSQNNLAKTTLASTITANTMMAPSIIIIVHHAIGSVVAPIPSTRHQLCPCILLPSWFQVVLDALLHQSADPMTLAVSPPSPFYAPVRFHRSTSSRHTPTALTPPWWGRNGEDALIYITQPGATAQCLLCYCPWWWHSLPSLGSSLLNCPLGLDVGYFR
jgi:hypothetical protein